MSSASESDVDDDSSWIVSKLQRHFDWLNDCRWNWTPFYNLRPQQHEFIRIGVILVFSAFCFGPLAAGGGLLIFTFLCNNLGMPENLAALIACVGAAMALLVTFAQQYVSFHFWNRRAHQIRKATGFSVPVDDAFLVTSGMQASDDPFRPPRVATSTLDPDQLQPLPLRYLGFGGEILFSVGTLVIYGIVLPSNLEVALPGMGFLQILLEPVLHSLVVVAPVAVLCGSFSYTSSNSGVRLTAVLFKLAICLSWMFTSLLLFACILATSSASKVPVLIWGWSAIAALVMLAATAMQFRLGQQRFNHQRLDSVFSSPKESFGWDVH